MDKLGLTNQLYYNKFDFEHQIGDERWDTCLGGIAEWCGGKGEALNAVIKGDARIEIKVIGNTVHHWVVKI